MLKWTTILAGIAGAAMGIYVVSTQPSPSDQVKPPPASPPSVNPFAHGIAAAGQVEASSRNVAISAPEPGLVVAVHTSVGERVKAGDPLFELDTRLLKAELGSAQAAREAARAQAAVAEARLARARAQPRPEEIPPLQAMVERAEAFLADQQQQLDELTTAGRGAAATQMEIDRRRFAVEMARAERTRAQADLALKRAGAWQADIQVAEAEVEQARAGVRQAEAAIAALTIRIDRLIVRSPIDGTVLKRNVEPGQYASTGSGGGAAQASAVVGDLRSLRVRARVDEEDAPLLRDGARAAARVRGLTAETIPLTWMWVEPLAQPKIDLTGSNIERVDTRVVEVLFQIEGTPKSRLFPGQVVDVYIQTEGEGQGRGGGGGGGGA